MVVFIRYPEYPGYPIRIRLTNNLFSFSLSSGNVVATKPTNLPMVIFVNTGTHIFIAETQRRRGAEIS